MVITLDPSVHGVPSRSAPSPTIQSFPLLRVASAVGFDNSRKLRRLSCLQLTQTALFFPWKSASLRAKDAHEEDMASDEENIHAGWDSLLPAVILAHRVYRVVRLAAVYDRHDASDGSCDAWSPSRGARVWILHGAAHDEAASAVFLSTTHGRKCSPCIV